jgi:hypothetical protein
MKTIMAFALLPLRFVDWIACAAVAVFKIALLLFVIGWITRLVLPLG